jgi:DNA-binding response OmpR family regulator
MTMSRILVIEPEPNLRRLYQRELAREGDVVLTVGNELDAVRQLERGRPDVVVLDVGPPPCGLGVVERLLARDRTIPIVLNTTCRSYTDDPLAWAVDAYVDKSSDLGELRARVHELLCSRSISV